MLIELHCEIQAESVEQRIECIIYNFKIDSIEKNVKNKKMMAVWYN